MWSILEAVIVNLVALLIHDVYTKTYSESTSKLETAVSNEPQADEGDLSAD